MDIKINKDFTKYRIEKWKGFSREQIIGGVFLFFYVCGGLYVFNGIFKVPTLLSLFLLTPIGTLITLIVCYRPNNMSFLAFIRKCKGPKILVYRSIRDTVQEKAAKEQIQKKNRQTVWRITVQKIIKQGKRIGVQIVQRIMTFLKPYFEKIKAHIIAEFKRQIAKIYPKKELKETEEQQHENES